MKGVWVLFKDGHSPLHLAALCGRDSACSSLLKFTGVNVNAVDHVGACIVDAWSDAIILASTLLLPAVRTEGRLYT